MPKKIKIDSKEQMLVERNKGIGGSDLKYLLGLVSETSKYYISPYQFWEFKKGIKKPDQNEDDRAFYGSFLEPTIANIFTHITGMKVYNEKYMYADDDYDFLIANIDRSIVSQNDGRGVGILECKNVGYDMYNFTDQFSEGGVSPMHYVQLQHYFSVLKRLWGHFALFIGGNEFEYPAMAPDEKLIKILREVAVNWWELHIIDNIKPGKNAWDYKHSEPIKNSILKADKELIEMISSYKEKKNLSNALIKDIENLRNLILEKCQDNESVKYNDEIIATIKSQQRTEFDKKKFKIAYPELYPDFTYINTSRVIRIKEQKNDN